MLAESIEMWRFRNNSHTKFVQEFKPSKFFMDKSRWKYQTSTEMSIQTGKLIISNCQGLR